MSHSHHQQNRLSWNEATQRHRSHKPDLIANFKANPRELYPEDVSLLGDVRGKTLAHLQCNDGQDTLSIAHHLGAIATGIDISDSAIEFARELSAETGISATFVRADIFEWFAQNENPVDVIYTSYGTINWIADIQQWANGIAKNLKTGGKFVMIDFHGMMGMFNLDWTLGFDYMGGKTYDTGGVGDYVGNDWEEAYKNPHTAYEFAWGVGDIVGALIKAELNIRHFEEYPFVNGWQRFPNMREGEGGRFYVPEGQPNIAMMFSVLATK
jgi:SAM-dependent methyltransferase